jgi:hypothetical protein
MRATSLAVLGLLLAGALVVSGASAGHKSGHAKKPKVEICHQRDDGSYRLIRIGKPAARAHERHGDAYPGDEVDGGTLDENCDVQPPQPVRYSSGPMVFGPNGWGGWSCPAGMTAVGGGYEPATATVAVSQLAGPGSVWPHYTFGPDESGWVVQNDNDQETIAVYVDCVPSA